MRSIHQGSVRAALLSLALVLTTALHPAAAADYDGVTVTFDKPVEQVQKAAIDALTVVGVDVKKQEPGYLEGKRKNKVGLFVGAGGEVISVKLTAIDSGKTEAKVRTTKTFVGRAGQKVWDQPVIDEMTKALGAAGSAGAAPATAEPADGTPQQQ